jgi:hypothetical protein
LGNNAETIIAEKIDSIILKTIEKSKKENEKKLIEINIGPNKVPPKENLSSISNISLVQKE